MYGQGSFWTGVWEETGAGLAWGWEVCGSESLTCDKNMVVFTKFFKRANNAASKVGPIGSPAGCQASMTMSPRQAHKNTREPSDRLMPQEPRRMGLLHAE